MRRLYISDSVDCRLFRGWVYHFQAGELAEPDQAKLQAHVDACRECSRYLELEISFLRGLKKRWKGEEAPLGLEARVLKALEREAPSVRRGGGPWYQRSAVSALAAGLLLVALIASPFSGRAITNAGVMRVSRAVTIVDGDCDAAGVTLRNQLACRDTRHLNVLKVADGMYWNVNPDRPAARDILLDPHQRGRRVVIEADYYPALRTVQLIRVQEPDPSEL